MALLIISTSQSLSGAVSDTGVECRRAGIVCLHASKDQAHGCEADADDVVINTENISS